MLGDLWVERERNSYVNRTIIAVLALSLMLIAQVTLSNLFQSRGE